MHRIGQACRGGDGQDGGDKSKGGAQVSGKLPFADSEIQKCAYAVHEKTGRRVHIQQERYQYGGAEHGKKMLQAEGNGGQDGKPFFRLDDSMGHFFLLVTRISKKRKPSPTKTSFLEKFL